MTVRVDELVAEGSAENADNDRANYYQIAIKGWKSASCWAGHLPRGLLLWAGKPVKKNSRESLKSQNRRVVGADNVYWVSVLGVIRLGLGVFYAILLELLCQKGKIYGLR